MRKIKYQSTYFNPKKKNNEYDMIETFSFLSSPKPPTRETLIEILRLCRTEQRPPLDDM